MHPAAETYRDLLTQLDRWFAGARARHGDVIPCRSGCTACCHGLFDISVADQLLLRETIATLPAGVRAGILARAERLLDRLQAVAPEWGPPWDIAAIGEDRFDEICLALHDLLENACPIQERFPAYALLDPVPFDLEVLEAAEIACLEAAAVEVHGTPTAAAAETTIAPVAAGAVR